MNWHLYLMIFYIPNDNIYLLLCCGILSTGPPVLSKHSPFLRESLDHTYSRGMLTAISQKQASASKTNAWSILLMRPVCQSASMLHNHSNEC